MCLLNRIFFTFYLLVVADLCQKSVAQNPPDYEQRRIDYIQTTLADSLSDVINLQAFTGDSVNLEKVNNILAVIKSKSTIDFDIVKLVRVLFLTDSTQQGIVLQNQILPALQTIPFWLTKGDTIRGYWSENHMIMWMSSNWLLHERFSFAIDTSLDHRLRHYLKLKIKYGFYEFFSSTYAPYCLSGLLNLVDFARDAEIKSLAGQAAIRLMKELLMVTNDKGVFFPAAGRNYYGKYTSAYGQNHNDLIYLLTGMGEAPSSASHGGGFLATSSIQVEDAIASWTPQLDTIYQIGHSLDTGFVINSSQTWLDKILFQWSSGAYFHPDVVEETVTLMNDSAIWNHVDFTQLSILKSVTPAIGIKAFAENLSQISKSSVIVGQEVAIFRNNSVVLTSIQDFWKGKVGYQQFPCVATVGTAAVLTGSGMINKNWSKRNSNNANEHLPYVSQKSNVALLMYRPEQGNILLKSQDVALHWPDADFDETREADNWLMGRQGDSYIGVRRHCIKEIAQVRACDKKVGQTWVIIVGNADMHGSFANFQNIINQSVFEEEWYYSLPDSQGVYYARIIVDNKTVEHTWTSDGPIATNVQNVSSDNHEWLIYPNPAKNTITINLTGFMNQQVAISVWDILGREVYYEEAGSFNFSMKQIDISGWLEGIYVVGVKDESGLTTKKLIKH